MAAANGKSKGGKGGAIEQFVAGDNVRHSLVAAVMNELVDAINALRNPQVVPNACCSVDVSDGNITFTFKTPGKARGFIQNDDGSLSVGTFVLLGTFTPDPPPDPNADNS